VRPPDAYALWLDDVMQGLNLTRVSLVGVPLGGWLALDYAMRRPEQVTRLARLSPGGVGRRKAGILFKAAPLLSLGHWGRRKALTLALGPESRASAPGNGTSRNLARDSALFDLVLLIFKHFKPRMQAQPIFADTALKGLAMPVLAMVGGRDTMLDSHETKRRLEAMVPDATVHLLPEVGHLLPDQSATLLDFLRNPHESGSDG
jgi:pimeloyl-ACP methyl ester carboxylesterase